MKRTNTLLFILLVFSACQKEWTAVFKGRLVYSCDGNTPVTGMLVDIHQTDAHDDHWLCHATTDENGYYAVTTDVNNFGKHDYFSLSCNGFAFDTIPIYPVFAPRKMLTTSDSKSKEIIMSASLNYFQSVQFHIKNIDVHDSSDVFTDLRQIGANGEIGKNLLTELLYGSVDTLLTIRGTESWPFKFKYTFMKSGGFTTVESSIEKDECFTTLTTDVFY